MPTGMIAIRHWSEPGYSLQRYEATDVVSARSFLPRVPLSSARAELPNSHRVIARTIFEAT
jgi:hypothetical protein